MQNRRQRRKPRWLEPKRIAPLRIGPTQPQSHSNRTAPQPPTETGTVLHHATANGEEANVFFGSDDRAEECLERLSDGVDSDRYEGLLLYQARTRKVKDAVDVLMDQSEFDEFVPDRAEP